ncbi:MAG: PEP/pyruvate-binding domain-containing protein [Acidimicrobiales bacterium]
MYTLHLDGRCSDSAVLGGKGASLDHLFDIGMPVPPTAVVTTAAYRRFVAHPDLIVLTDRIRGGETVAAPDVDAGFLSIDFDHDLALEVEEVAVTVGAGRALAIRSSATVEDMDESSFAGQYRSLLDVDPKDTVALHDAVRLVFASLWHPAPCAYRRAFGIDDEAAAMATVLMQMVPTVRAGVVFTVDPGGEADAARIEAVDGLGESLVSGQRTPDAWVTPRTPIDPALPDEAAQALRLAMTIESDTTTAQDVEWAWDGDQTWVVQARPITVAVDDDHDGFDSHPGQHDLTTAGIGEMLPGVLPPLLWELDSHLVDEAFRHVLDDLGVLPTELERTHLIRRVRGRAALDFTRLRQMAEDLPGGAAEQLETQYFGSGRGGRPAVPTAQPVARLTSLRHDYRVLRARRRNGRSGEIIIEAVAELIEKRPDLEQKENSGLLGYRLGLVDLAQRAMTAELSVAADAAAAYRRIEVLLLPHLGEVEAGRRAEVVTAVPGVTATPMLDDSAALVGGPTWQELGRQPVQVARSERADHSAMDDLEDTLARCPTWGHGTLRSAIRVRALHQSVDEAITQLRRREHLKTSVLRLGGEIRRVHLELGRRLVQTGAIGEPADIDLLTSVELHQAMVGNPPPPQVVGGRRRWRARYESEPPLPSRFSGRPDVVAVELPPGGRLDGWAASSGRFTGRAQVVSDPDADLRPGAILVAQATDASWSPLFVDAGAIVLERGGPLSHAAILARELGVPAVLNVPGATQHLDGLDLTVDGDAGIVVLHDELAPSAP